MFYIKSSILVLIILSINGFAQDAYKNAGNASVLLLRFGPSAKVSSISESFCGLANDENALYYNPAGLINIESTSIGLNHLEWIEDIRIDNLSFAYLLKDKYGLGAGITHMWMPSILGRDELGNETGNFSVSTTVINLGFAYKFHSYFSSGIAIKYFNDKLANVSASGIAFDLGIFSKRILPELSGGLVIQNIGSKIKFGKREENIPFTLRAGVAYKVDKYDLQFSSDIVKSIDTDYYVNFGIEYVYDSKFFIRIGNRFSRRELIKLSYGAGFNVYDKYSLNYTLINLPDLGLTHNIGFTFKLDTQSKTGAKIKSNISTQSLQLRPPENLNAKIESDKMIISWEKVTGAFYNVYARHSSQKSWKKLNIDPITSSSMEFKKPQLKGDYYFRVSAIIEDKESNYSEETVLNVK